MTHKCHYCEEPATKNITWLKDRRQRPARITLPWCGCDLMEALKRFWISPYRSFKVRKSYFSGLRIQEASPCRYTHDTFCVLQLLALRRGSYPLSPKGLADYFAWKSKIFVLTCSKFFQN
jgi:hypothetical protein